MCCCNQPVCLTHVYVSLISGIPKACKPNRQFFHVLVSIIQQPVCLCTKLQLCLVLFLRYPHLLSQEVDLTLLGLLKHSSCTALFPFGGSWIGVSGVQEEGVVTGEGGVEGTGDRGGTSEGKSAEGIGVGGFGRWRCKWEMWCRREIWKLREGWSE